MNVPNLGLRPGIIPWYFLIVFLIIPSFLLKAHNPSVFKKTPYSGFYSLSQITQIQPLYADTTLSGFQLYDPLLKTDPFFAVKGNIGHMGRPLRFNPAYKDGFAYFPANQFGNNRFFDGSLKYYKPEHIFTEMFYVTGASREQLFRGMHHQRLSENLFVGMDYQVVNSPGFYSRMAARNSNLALTTEWQTNNARYQVKGGFWSNRLETLQSGGLRNHLNFEENPVRDSVFLYRASARYRETGISLAQGFRFSQNASEDNKASINPGRIIHEFVYNTQVYAFDENQLPYPFFSSPPAFETASYDSVRIQSAINRFSWTNSTHENQTLRIRLHAKHEWNRVLQPDYVNLEAPPTKDEYVLGSEDFQHITLGFEFAGRISGSVNLFGKASQTRGGYRDGEIAAEGGVLVNADRLGLLTLTLGHWKERPDYIFSRFYSNYISWENQLGLSEISRLGVSVSWPFLKLEANVYELRNQVYLNHLAIPVQNPDAVRAFTAAATLNFSFGVFRSRHQWMFQHFSSTNFERFPGIAGYNSLYADTHLFEGALGLQAGFDFTWIPSYEFMRFMPVNGLFYAQNTYSSRDAYLLDAFVNLQIKRTRFFLKMQNLSPLAGTLPNYSIPFYPLPDTAFKFGVSWLFFD